MPLHELLDVAPVTPRTRPSPRPTLAGRWLDLVERVGNRCPDPILLFLVALAATWGLSALLAGIDFGVLDPRNGQPLRINDQLTLVAMSAFLANMTVTYVTFPPLGMVLVMVLGVGLAERSGLLAAALRGVLAVAPVRLLTPLVVLAAIVAHVLSDSALVIVLPLAAALFYVAGRHPLLGIVASFAPLSGLLFGSLLPQSLDAILAGFTEGGARLIDPAFRVTPLNNYWLAAAIALAAVPATWWMVDRTIAPRVADIVVDGDPALMPSAPPLTAPERRGLWGAALACLAVLGAVAWAAWPAGSPLRGADGSLTGAGAPLMRGMTPILLVLAAVPALVYGRVAGTMRTHRDAIEGMSATMASMNYYLVMVFFAALFTRTFAESNIGALVAVTGADALRASGLPGAITILGVVGLTFALDVIVPSASAKWALLAPILVPMLMSAGLSPHLTQAAFRIGDGPMNLMSPLFPYFPLVLAFCRRYVTTCGLGTIMALVLPLGVMYLGLQVAMLMAWWALGLPLGVGAGYAVP
ncbi:aminobenzoyl-glutamate transporter [Luteitalea sp. TBR-22]|uniref:AbgT family transporter n=1 Tax=Luteitalea sp. TBR-22 TaxID=2802971 RepID=UPI001AFA9E66|nr:AbgT family transporter [Luteitalea sp. TBR-22]BCS31941.1 aminobenzoyl-glutamate transporter [Luteitalea sp. TBR-22]